MKRISLKFFISFLTVMALSASILLDSGFARQKGEVVFGVAYPIFYQVGGDPATHMAGLPLVAQTVFDNLIWASPDQKVMPAIAKKHVIHPKWKYIDFYLRDDVKFHNGMKLTAEDVKYSLETYLRKELRFLFRPLWIRKIKSIEEKGTYHIRINFNSPDPGFLGRLWWGAGIFPKAYREKVGDKVFADKPVGSGPFRWKDYKQDVYWRAEAVENHFRHTPEFKTFKLVYAQEASTRLAMLQSGEADIVVLSQAHIPVVKADPDLRVVYAKYPQLTTLTIADLEFPKENSPLLDKRVRKAVSLAIDRKMICDKLLNGSAEPYGEVLSPITMGHDPSIEPDPYDPKRARQLLKEAGYPNGFKTFINTTITSKFWAEAVAANLMTVGIQAKINIHESGAWQQAFRGRKMRGLMITGMWHHSEYHPSADMSDHMLSYMPWCYHSTKKIDGAIHAGMMAIEEKDVIAAGRKISKAIREDFVKIILWAQHDPYGVGPRIKSWQPQKGARPASAFEFITLNK